jgi:uncharacterized protein (TIRG00374 family)
VGVFFNNVFPGSTGGDVTRLYLLGRDNRGAISNIAGFALFDRIVGFSAVAVTAAVAMGYALAWEGSRLQGEWSGLLWVIFFACLAPVIFFAALFFGRVPFIRGSARRMFSLVPKSAWIVNFLLTLEGFIRHKDAIVWAFVISILSCAVQLVGVTVLSWALFGVNAIFPALVTTPIVMLSGVIPFTPGNVGGSEYLASILWNLFGVAGGGTLWASFRVVIVTTSLFGGVLYLFKFRGATKSAELCHDLAEEPEFMPKRSEKT